VSESICRFDVFLVLHILRQNVIQHHFSRNQWEGENWTHQELRLNVKYDDLQLPQTNEDVSTLSTTNLATLN